ncbi:hypothetical protein Bca4012_071300 [Brassica carinata]|uniref:Uncharacterized protein n=1 Tax=Brassica carinata TaxID=52824 RepID=A0A8X7U9B7_BRACI|nr:hypothetical protein Bca52824_063581 [Brassica carinata]
MALRTQPDALTLVLTNMKERPTYQGQDKLPVIIWMMAQLVDEWKVHSLKLSSSPSDTLTVKHAMNSFKMKNEKARTEGVTNLSLYKEADKSCKLISRRLSCGLRLASLTTMVIAAAGGFAGAALFQSILPIVGDGFHHPSRPKE